MKKLISQFDINIEALEQSGLPDEFYIRRAAHQMIDKLSDDDLKNLFGATVLDPRTPESRAKMINPKSDECLTLQLLASSGAVRYELKLYAGVMVPQRLLSKIMQILSEQERTRDLYYELGELYNKGGTA